MKKRKLQYTITVPIPNFYLADNLVAELAKIVRLDVHEAFNWMQNVQVQRKVGGIQRFPVDDRIVTQDSHAVLQRFHRTQIYVPSSSFNTFLAKVATASRVKGISLLSHNANLSEAYWI